MAKTMTANNGRMVTKSLGITKIKSLGKTRSPSPKTTVSHFLRMLNISALKVLIIVFLRNSYMRKWNRQRRLDQKNN